MKRVLVFHPIIALLLVGLTACLNTRNENLNGQTHKLQKVRAGNSIHVSAVPSEAPVKTSCCCAPVQTATKTYR